MAPLSLPARSAAGQQDSNNGPPASTASSQEVFRFFDLPAELQVLILRHAHVSESELEISTRHLQDKTFRCDLSSHLLRVSTWFYAEGRSLLYRKNVFKIKKRGDLNTTAFLLAIGSQNRNLIHQLTISSPYRQVLAYRQQSRCLTQVLEGIGILEIEFNWSRIPTGKRKTQVIDYKPALEALAMILRTRGGRYAKLSRAIGLPSSAFTAPYLPRVKLVSAPYQTRPGVSSLTFGTSELLC